MKKPANKPRRTRHSEPSAASLREIPELSKDAVFLGRGREGLERAIALSRARRGRPKKGTPSAPTTTRSVRFSADTWAELERRAKERGVPLHALLRDIIAGWLTDAA